MERPVARLMYRLRTDASSPSRQAAAVALGTYIGCTPFYGFHLWLSLALGWVFGLNRLKVYLAANISHPLAAPLIVTAELQLGAWLTRGAWYSPASIADAHLWGITHDLLLGSLAVGAVLAMAAAGLTYAVVARRSLPAALSKLIDEAAGRYLHDTCSSWEFANGKLRMDPVYLGLLKRGVLPQQGTLVDCGCGRGLMLSLIATAQDLRDQAWPRTWPDPPAALRLYGIETRPRMVKKARRALGDRATILAGDLRDMPLPQSDVALVFDVVHLMPRLDQEKLLARLRDALPPGGLLILREADAEGGWRFRAVQFFNGCGRLVQGQWGRRFHFRTADGWRQCLSELGFDVETEPMGDGTPFANVMFYARRKTAS